MQVFLTPETMSLIIILFLNLGAATDIIQKWKEIIVLHEMNNKFSLFCILHDILNSVWQNVIWRR
jgi:hypothetical protein